MSVHALESPPSGVARQLGRVLLPVVIILAGILVLLYPVISTQWNNYRQGEVANHYAQLIQETPEVDRFAEVRAAEEYNAEHTDRPILDPWLSRISEDNTDYQEYLDQLSSAPAMSQVVVPAIDVNLPIYHGTDMKTLDRGVGHLYGSALPVGGVGHHSVLTGHTGLTNATLFDNLTKVQEGDAIYLNTFGRKLKYEVDQIKVVLPNETDDLKAEADRDLITLITCAPYGINTHRLLVRATRVDMDPEEEASAFGNRSGIQWQWWMFVVLAAAAVVLLLLIWWIVRTMSRLRGDEMAK